MWSHLVRLSKKRLKSNKYEVLHVVFLYKLCVQEQSNAFLITQKSCRLILRFKNPKEYEEGSILEHEKSCVYGDTLTL